jgi:hypothetical protein
MKQQPNASEDLAHDSEHSNRREVRFALFPWPSENASGLLAVLQYNFLGANPPMCCLSIGLLVHLSRTAANCQVRDEFLLQTSHHGSIQRASLIDLTGNGTPELVIESDVGGMGSAASTLQIFDLSGPSFHELLNVYSRLEYMDEEGYSQIPDIERTRQARGGRFCTTKTLIFEKGTWFLRRPG